MEKRSSSSFKTTFLTDNVKLTEESAEVKARRADFVHGALQPVSRIFLHLQEDCKALDTQVQSEISMAFQAMKQAAERKFQAAAKRLQQAQRRLEELEEEFEREEAVLTVRREIELYSDKAEKMDQQLTVLREQHLRYKAGSEELAAQIHAKGTAFNEVSRDNLDLHRAIAAFRVPETQSRPNFPLMNLFESVPFEVFSELSAKDVGFLSIAQIQTFIKYKKHLEGVKAQVDRAKMETEFQRLAHFGDRSKVRLEDIFAQCVAACTLQSFVASLEDRFFPLATISDFKTVCSSRLYDIGKAQDSIARQRRRPLPLYSRQDLRTLPPDYLLSILLKRKDCVERLQYFLTHPNPFRSSLAETFTKEFSSLPRID